MTTATSVSLCEVGPRDGFQYESKPIPTDFKLELIRDLLDAGIRRMQVASFVHPERVPQMADAERVVAGLPHAQDAVFTGLALNRRGVVRAAASGLKAVDLSIATNEKHGRDNAAMSVDEGVAEARAMIEEAQRLGLTVQLGLQTVFGYALPGDTDPDKVTKLAHGFADMGIESLSLADTTGMATPALIHDRVRRVQSVVGTIPVVLHIHDTRGLGLVNVQAGWEAGVSRFDVSFGGLGGCPFIPGAAGNVATEDVAYLFEAMNVSTDIRIAAVAEASRKMAAFLGRELTGKMYRIA